MYVHTTHFFTSMVGPIRNRYMNNHYNRQARIQGGARRVFVGGKNKGGQKPHTQKKKSKSDNHEARYSLKRTPKHTKYAQNRSSSTSFSKISWGRANPPPPPEERVTGPPPPSLPSLRRLTPFIIPQKKYSCHFYIFIINVYISNVFASLVVQF